MPKISFTVYLFPIIAGKGEGAKGGEFSSLMRMLNYLIINYKMLNCFKAFNASCNALREKCVNYSSPKSNSTMAV